MSKIRPIGLISLMAFCIVQVAFAGTPLDNPRAVSSKSANAEAATRIVELQSILSAPLPRPNMNFGYSVAISGDRIVVGALYADQVCPTCTGAGAAYIFRRDGQQWLFEKKLVASEQTNGDAFGFSVAIDGDTIVVGAPQVPVGNNSAVGAIYVFQRNGFDWLETAKRLHPESRPQAYFGSSVGIAGDLIVVGSPGSLGRAYVYGRDGGWVLDATLAPWDGISQGFGKAVTVSGNSVVVTGTHGDAPGIPNSGAAYVFRKTLAPWTREAKIVPDFPISNAEFGQSAAMFGDSILIGALTEKAFCPPDLCNPGAAYLFRRNGSIWTQVQRFEYPSNGDPGYNAHFGVGVALSNDLALVGASNEDGPNCPDGGCDHGAVYSFLQSDNQWNPLTQMSSPKPVPNAQFGFAVAATDTAFAVGAYFDDYVSQQGGAVYLYRVFVDCNGNGTPDQLEVDCNSNEVPDNCDIADGTSNDCNANTVPDECDLSNGPSADCNGNEIPDECDTLFASFESSSLGPIGFGAQQVFTIINPPPSGGQVRFWVDAKGDLGSTSEALDVQLNGIPVGTLFGVGGTDCPVVPNHDEFLLSAADFNCRVAEGNIQVRVVGSAAVDPNPPECQSSVRIRVEYQAVTAGDCNGNGNPDSCEIAQGLVEDCNDNLMPDGCDIQMSISNDCDNNGVPDECEGNPAIRIIASYPPDGSIDARTDLDSSETPEGIDRVRMTFTCQPFTEGMTALLASSFVAASSGGPAPSVVQINREPCQANTLELVLSSPIPAGSWTTITANIESSAGAAIDRSAEKVTLGFLPGDVNGGGTSTPSDILDLVDNLNQVRVPALNPWQCDIDRSGVCAPADILLQIDLLNGVRTSRAWNGVSLPPVP